MKLDVEFTQAEIEILAQMAKRFGRTSKARLKNDNVEILLAEHEYEKAKSAMNKIADKFSKDGLYYEMANRHEAKLSEYTRTP